MKSRRPRNETRFHPSFLTFSLTRPLNRPVTRSLTCCRFNRSCLILSLLVLSLIFPWVPAGLPGGLALQAAPSGEKSPSGYAEALALYEKGEYGKSLEKIRSSVTPTHKPYAMRMLAAANYEKLGKAANAIEHMNWCIREHPRRFEPALMLAGLLRGMKRYAQAARSAALGIRRVGENVSLRREIALNYYMLGNFRLARYHLDLALARGKNNIEIVYLDGLLFLRQGKLDSADFRLRHALDLKPDNTALLADIYNNLGLIAELRGDAVRASRKKRAAKLYAEARRYYRFSRTVLPSHAKSSLNLKRLEKKL